jgi:quinone-modifying oxidoreductase subunit QmoA
MNRYFPKLCPPTCGLEINFKRIKQNRQIRVLTLAEIEKISGQRGDFQVTIRLNPRYVNEKCTACGKCAEVCSLEIANEFNYRMDKIKAAYLPHEMAFPMRYVLDPRIIRTADAQRCAEACEYHAVDLSMQPRQLELNVGSIVWATGWNPYDAGRLDNLGGGRYPNVITNVVMERMASLNGPTGGKIVRPSDGKDIQRVAFVQCAGSRDENHLPYCSAVCCSASLKQATYVRDQNPESKVYIFYLDLRTPGRLEEFYTKVQSDENIFLVKGKIARITEDTATRNVTVEAEDIASGKRIQMKVDLVVLATGMVPTTAEWNISADLHYDQSGFIISGFSEMGMHAVGCVKRPLDVASSVKDATGTALKAIQSVLRR